MRGVNEPQAGIGGLAVQSANKAATIAGGHNGRRPHQHGPYNASPQG